LLRAWKTVSEDQALDRVGKTAAAAEPAVEDKFVGYGYIEETGILAELKESGYHVQWVHSFNEHLYVETKGWEVVMRREKNGCVVQYKVRELDCEYMILLKKKE
jgi:hypothetical protein